MRLSHCMGSQIVRFSVGPGIWPRHGTTGVPGPPRSAPPKLQTLLCPQGPRPQRSLLCFQISASARSALRAFPSPLHQMTTNSAAVNDPDVLTYSSGGREHRPGSGLKSSCWKGCVPSGSSGEDLFLGLSQCLEATAVIGGTLIGRLLLFPIFCDLDPAASFL